MWISLPSVFIPKIREGKDETKVDPLYQQIFLAFSRSIEANNDNLLLPRAKIDGEEMAVVAMRPLLEVCTTDELPGMVVDCRSSAPVGGPAPTYKLVAKSGLTSALPFSLGGQAGSEVVQAILFLQHMLQGSNNAVITAIQRMVPPDTRLKEEGFPLADASAAILFSKSRIKSIDGFSVLSVAVGQQTKDWYDVLEPVLAKAIKRAGIKKDAIQWSVAHRFSESFLTATSETLSDSMWLTRDVYLEFDFGCVDSFVSLSRLFGKTHLPQNGIGALWFAGRFGSVGVVLLKYCKEK